MGAKGLVWLKVGADGALESPVVKFLCRGRAGRARSTRLDAEPGDLLLIVADEWATAVRGARTRCATTSVVRPCTRVRTATCGSSTSRCSSASTRRPAARSPAHHPFTQPHPDDVAHARVRPAEGAQPGLRPRAQRVGARVRGRSGSTSPSCSADLPTCSASATKRPTSASGSSSTRSATAPRRTAGSPSASIAWWRSSPARRTSVRSSPSRRRSRASIR